MFIDEYNRHATLGSLAGPPTNASQLAGQQAYDNAHRQIPQGSYVPHSGKHGEIPKFLRVGALRRGLWTMGIAVLVSTVAGLFLRPGTNVYDAVGAVTGIAFLFGFFLVICGVISKVAARRRKKAAEVQAVADKGPGQV